MSHVRNSYITRDDDIKNLIRLRESAAERIARGDHQCNDAIYPRLLSIDRERQRIREYMEGRK